MGVWFPIDDLLLYSLAAAKSMKIQKGNQISDQPDIQNPRILCKKTLIICKVCFCTSKQVHLVHRQSESMHFSS